MKAANPRRSYLDTAEQISALLDAAGQIGADPQSHPQIETRLMPRRAILATLIFARLRIGGTLGLGWQDVDLAVGRLRIGHAKTDAGTRDVHLLATLHDMLSALKAQRGELPPSGTCAEPHAGRRQSEANVRQGILAKAVTKANDTLAEHGQPLPASITPHSLRRTFTSVLYALGGNPAGRYAGDAHTDPGLALRRHAQAMRRDELESRRLRAPVDVTELAVVGSSANTVPHATFGSGAT